MASPRFDPPNLGQQKGSRRSRLDHRPISRPRRGPQSRYVRGPDATRRIEGRLSDENIRARKAEVRHMFEPRAPFFGRTTGGSNLDGQQSTCSRAPGAIRPRPGSTWLSNGPATPTSGRKRPKATEVAEITQFWPEHVEESSPPGPWSHQGGLGQPVYETHPD